jgi:hypothetical protein
MDLGGEDANYCQGSRNSQTHILETSKPLGHIEDGGG